MSQEMSPLLKKAHDICLHFYEHIILGGTIKDGYLERAIYEALQQEKVCPSCGKGSKALYCSIECCMWDDLEEGMPDKEPTVCDVSGVQIDEKK